MCDFVQAFRTLVRTQPQTDEVVQACHTQTEEFYRYPVLLPIYPRYTPAYWPPVYMKPGLVPPHHNKKYRFTSSSPRFEDMPDDLPFGSRPVSPIGWLDDYKGHDAECRIQNESVADRRDLRNRENWTEDKKDKDAPNKNEEQKCEAETATDNEKVLEILDDDDDVENFCISAYRFH